METICTNITVNLSQLNITKKKKKKKKQLHAGLVFIYVYLKFNNKLVNKIFSLFKDLA